MKELVVDFLEEIVTLFFPDLARQLDFSQTRDLNKELYTASPEGAERFVDVLIEVQVKEKPSEVVLIHFESQQRKRFDFPVRMLGYHCLIYAREIEGERQDSFSLAEFRAWQDRKRILSFAFCNYPLRETITQEECHFGFHQTRLSCEFTGISFPMCLAREYLQKDNSVVCALAVFMDATGFSPPELKAACYHKLLDYQSNLTRKKLDDIVYALETYIQLSDEEAQVFQRLIQEIYPEVNQMITNPLVEQGRQQGRQQGIEQGRQQGIEQGRQQGIEQGVQRSILRILSRRFTEFPSEIRSQIMALNDAEKLERLLDAALEVDSLEDLTQNGFFEV